MPSANKEKSPEACSSSSGGTAEVISSLIEEELVVGIVKETQYH